MPGGGTVIDPVEARRSGEDEPARRHQPRQIVAAGELTAVWVPDEAHEAMRDLVRTRDAAVNDLRAKRQRVTSFLLRYGRSYPGRKTLGRPLCRMLRAVLSRCWRLTAPHGVICDLRQQRSAPAIAETRI